MSIEEKPTTPMNAFALNAYFGIPETPLGFLLLHLAARYRSRVEEAISSEKAGFGLNEFRILTFIKGVTPWRELIEAERSGVNQQAIAEFCELNKSTVVYAIDRLEKLKLVRREADPRDRRVNFVFLTDSGYVKAEKLLAQIHSLEKEMYSPLSEEEQRKLRKLMLKPIVSGEFARFSDDGK